MTTESMTVQDRLLAQLDLAEERLDRFSAQLAKASERSQERFSERLDRVTARLHALAEQVRDASPISDSTEAAVEDVNAAVDTLEADLDAAATDGSERYRAVLDRQLRSWRARTEHLQLQSALGSMGIRDDLEELGTRLNRARSGALVELQRAASDSKEVVVDVRDDLEHVLTDVRHAVERVADALTHDTTA